MKRRHLRSYLTALVLAALLPAFAVAGFAVWRAASAYRDASVARLMDTSRTLARGVESELLSGASILRTLAVAPDATRGVADDLGAWLDRVGRQLDGRILVEDLAAAEADGPPALPSGVPRETVRAAGRARCWCWCSRRNAWCACCSATPAPTTACCWR